jgi:hypothetical protein
MYRVRRMVWRMLWRMLRRMLWQMLRRMPLRSHEQQFQRLKPHAADPVP